MNVQGEAFCWLMLLLAVPVYALSIVVLVCFVYLIDFGKEDEQSSTVMMSLVCVVSFVVFVIYNGIAFYITYSENSQLKAYQARKHKIMSSTPSINETEDVQWTFMNHWTRITQPRPMNCRHQLSKTHFTYLFEYSRFYWRLNLLQSAWKFWNQRSPELKADQVEKEPEGGDLYSKICNFRYFYLKNKMVISINLILKSF